MRALSIFFLAITVMFVVGAISTLNPWMAVYAVVTLIASIGFACLEMGGDNNVN